MGANCSPLIANLTLMSYELTYLLQKIKTQNPVKLLNLTYRLIDDITTFNDNNYFDNNFKEIYPDSLELNKINNNRSHAEVLDLSIEISPYSYATVNVFDKRDSFDFKINCYPNYKSTIALHVIKGTLTSQIKRAYSICSEIDLFLEKIKIIFGKFRSNNTPRRLLISWTSSIINKISYDNCKFHKLVHSFKTLDLDNIHSCQ